MISDPRHPIIITGNAHIGPPLKSQNEEDLNNHIQGNKDHIEKKNTELNRIARTYQVGWNTTGKRCCS